MKRTQLKRKTPLKPKTGFKKHKKPKKKVKKAPSVSSLKKKLWRLFTAFIKHRDNYTCVTCGLKSQGADMGGGHYIPKAACGLEYYFSEQNVHAQCSKCNCFLQGNIPAYRKYLVSKYGEKVLDDLENNYHKPYGGDSVAWLLEKIEHYKGL